MDERDIGDEDWKIVKESLAYKTLVVIRDLIMTGRIPPGSKLTERELADKLGVSRAPVREALIEFERLGLVVSKPNGRYVIKHSAQDVAQLYEARRPLEKVAAECAAKRIQSPDAKLLREELADMRKHVEAADYENFVAGEFSIHGKIWKIADNPFLLKMLLPFRQLEVQQLWSYEQINKSP